MMKTERQNEKKKLVEKKDDGVGDTVMMSVKTTTNEYKLIIAGWLLEIDWDDLFKLRRWLFKSV